jgi:hypothetical protein
MLELDDETSDLLKEIVAITGESYQDAVSVALDERIKRIRIYADRQNISSPRHRPDCFHGSR